MATYMSYEETIPLIRASVFNNFTFYTDEDIKAQIDLIADNPYGQLPPGVTPEQGALAKEQRKGEHPLTSKEKANQNKYAEALCLRDNRKASGIAHYINNILNREIDTSSLQKTGIVLMDQPLCRFQTRITFLIHNQELNILIMTSGSRLSSTWPQTMKLFMVW